MTTLVVVVLIAILLVLLVERSGIDGNAARILSLAIIVFALIYLASRYFGHL